MIYARAVEQHWIVMAWRTSARNAPVSEAEGCKVEKRDEEHLDKKNS
jgi:hypothetical protein